MDKQSAKIPAPLKTAALGMATVLLVACGGRTASVTEQRTPGMSITQAPANTSVIATAILAPAALPLLSATTEGGSAQSAIPEAGGNIDANALKGMSFYTERRADLETYAQSFEADNPGKAARIREYTAQPKGIWLSENWIEDISRYVHETFDAAGERIPVFVLYNMYLRDVEGESKGGAKTPEAYIEWIKELSRAVGDKKVVLVFEPDSAGHIKDLYEKYGKEEGDRRVALMKEALVILQQNNKNAVIYLALSGWTPAEENIKWLKEFGLEKAAVNVAGFTPDDQIDEEFNVQAIKEKIPNFRAVRDTSRSGGTVPRGEWCNPENALIGDKPEVIEGDAVFDANLWIKPADQSDGACNGGEPAGTVSVKRLEQLLGFK